MKVITIARPRVFQMLGIVLFGYGASAFQATAAAAQPSSQHVPTGAVVRGGLLYGVWGWYNPETSLTVYPKT